MLVNTVPRQRRVGNQHRVLTDEIIDNRQNTKAMVVHCSAVDSRMGQLSIAPKGHLLRQQLLQPTVLIVQCAQMLCIKRLHPAVLRIDIATRTIGDSMIDYLSNVAELIPCRRHT